MMERWITASEAARRLSITPARLNRLVKEGILPAPSYRCGVRSPRYDLQALDSAMTEAEASRDPDSMVEAYIAKERTKAT